MIALGISGAFGHDAAACLLQDGRVLAMAEEERFTRRRHAHDALPVNALRFCLAHGGVSPADIDVIAFGWNPRLQPRYGGLQAFGERVLRLDELRGARRMAVEWVDHHRAHAASAFFGSGFEAAAVLVIDGQGEAASTSWGAGHGRALSLQGQLPIAASLGHFYRASTRYVGFPEFAEGKFMGLAAYGRVLDVESPIVLTRDGCHFRFFEGRADVERIEYAEIQDATHRWLAAHVGDSGAEAGLRSRQAGGTAGLRSNAADVAATVTRFLSDAILHLAGLAVAAAGSRRLALAGGVALNCTANGRILRSGLVDELYIAPAANDAGSALGAAMDACARAGFASRLDRIDLGPDFTDEQMRHAASAAGLNLMRLGEDLADATARLIATGATVGWFQGRMEIGPRALGFRSTLCAADSIASRDRMNDVKGRERWRPLAPAILAEHVSSLAEGLADSPYMLLAASATPIAQRLVPGVVHADGTMRVQSVLPGSGIYRQVIEAVHERTGVPAIVNTSFNPAGDPIVCTPADAVAAFARGGLDALVLGPYMLLSDS
jgi:carbamoyltransferase